MKESTLEEFLDAADPADGDATEGREADTETAEGETGEVPDDGGARAASAENEAAAAASAGAESDVGGAADETGEGNGALERTEEATGAIEEGTSDPAADPAIVTYAWGVDRQCGACGEAADRLWRGDEGLVCPDCKPW